MIGQTPFDLSKCYACSLPEEILLIILILWQNSFCFHLIYSQQYEYLTIFHRHLFNFAMALVG